MPAAEPAGVVREGDALRFSGALLRDSVAGLWKQAATQLAGVRRIDLMGVSRVDSAGVALLAELAARAGDPVVEGAPEGLVELRAAYRMAPSLAFSG